MVARTEDGSRGGPVAPDAPRARYVGLSLDDGEVIIYDREEENAWIQSAAAVELQQVV